MPDEKFEIKGNGNVHGYGAPDFFNMEKLSRLESDALNIARQALESRKKLEADWVGYKARQEEELFLKESIWLQKRLENVQGFISKRISMEEKAKASIADSLEGVFAAYDSNNKRIFQISKAFSISRAVMNTYEAATKALASYPPPWSYAAAAATTAFGLTQVDQIRSMSFNSGKQSRSAQPVVSAAIGRDIGNNQVGLGSQPNPGKKSSGSQVVNIYINGNMVDLSQLARELEPFNIELVEDMI